MASSRAHNLYRRCSDRKGSPRGAAAGGTPRPRGEGPAHPLQPWSIMPSAN